MKTASKLPVVCAALVMLGSSFPSQTVAQPGGELPEDAVARFWTGTPREVPTTWLKEIEEFRFQGDIALADLVEFLRDRFRDINFVLTPAAG
jgi:hypothetical protein